MNIKNQDIVLASETYPHQTIRIPADYFRGSFSLPLVKGCRNEAVEIENSLNNPIGTEVFDKLIKGKKKILIISDDNTRITPVKKILDTLFRATAIKEKELMILVALGTHRPMPKEEMIAKFGSQIVKKIRIINHIWNNADNLVSFGKTAEGIDVWINKYVKQVDFIMGIGNIVPHATVGFSGGAKIIVPGICGERTAEEIHWKALEYDLADLLGVNNNPLRKTINRIAKIIGLEFIINTVLTSQGRIYRVVCGDPEKAHKKGVELCKKIYGVSVSKKADIVIADAYGTDIDLRQAIKGVLSANLLVNKGGVIILLAKCPEGVAPQFPQYVELGFHSPYQLKSKIEKGEIDFKLGGYTLVLVGRIISDKAKVILVSEGILRNVAEKMGFLWANNIQEALQLARKIKGNDASVLYLKRAGEILPVLID